MTLRQDLYAAARAKGDLDALRRGPAAVGRRAVRKTVYRHVNRHVGRALRRFGL